MDTTEVNPEKEPDGRGTVSADRDVFEDAS